MPDIEVSIVIPCLNEEQTLGDCLERAHMAIEVLRVPAEIIVSDNGSTDRSIAVAHNHGARVMHCKERGYGAALRHGISNAAGDVIVFADADNTYDFAETPRLVDELRRGYDLVIGDRIHGTIADGAMPFMHQYIGTPFLNFMINFLHARSGQRIRDCNSGFRCFSKAAFRSWDVESTGMEFASEMLIKALKHRARLSHVPITLHPDLPGRTPHLKRWRDGMRHLLHIMLEAPHFFYYSGVLLSACSWLIIILCLCVGPTTVAGMSIFGIHSMMYALLGSCFGLGIWAVGLALATRIATPVRCYTYLVALPEDKLFWWCLMTSVVCVVLLIIPVLYWANRGFHSLSIEKETLFITAMGVNGLFLVLHVLNCHLIRKST